MCTLSWFKTENGYELFFNRDELKKRRRAELPEVLIEEGVEIISPTDADAGGTWISVNQFGLSFCLLNHYEKEQLIPHTDWLSRGEIIRSLANSSVLENIEAQFDALNLTKYKPFRLFIIDAQGHSYFYTWDGSVSTMEKDIVTPRSSSSFEPEKVRKTRKLLFKKLDLNESTSRNSYCDFHTSHAPEKSAHSVCMHRDNANTVSFSHIIVSKACVSFAYADGQPCQVKLGDALMIQRVKVGHERCAIDAA